MSSLSKAYAKAMLQKQWQDTAAAQVQTQAAGIQLESQKTKATISMALVGLAALALLGLYLTKRKG